MSVRTQGTPPAPVRTAPAVTATPGAPVPSSAASAEPTPTPATGPSIYSVATTPNVAHTGQAIAWDVRTSSDIVSVAARVSVYTFPLQRRGPGHFILSFRIPANVPSVFHGTYNLEFTALTQSGSSAKRSVPMIFQ